MNPRAKKFSQNTASRRYCARCKTVKPLSDFHNMKGRALGKDYNCKLCRKVLTYAWKERNPERLREISMKASVKYYQAHREECLTKYKNYYREHREECLAAGKEYYWAHRSKLLAQKRLRYDTSKREGN